MCGNSEGLRSERIAKPVESSSDASKEDAMQRAERAACGGEERDDGERKEMEEKGNRDRHKEEEEEEGKKNKEKKEETGEKEEKWERESGYTLSEQAFASESSASILDRIDSKTRQAMLDCLSALEKRAG